MQEPFAGLDSRVLRIFYELYRRGPLTKKALQASMGLKLTTLNRAMKSLEDRSLIISPGEADSTGGRKAATYDVPCQGLYLLGVDLSRTYVKIVLTNLKLSIQESTTFFLSEEDSAAAVIRHTLLLATHMVRKMSISQNQILGVGIGTVGPLDRERGIMLSPRGFPGSGWEHVPLKSRTEAEFAAPCFVDNGANAAVLAEYLFGIGKNKRSIAYIHCGVGIRSAVIKDDRIIRTMNDREDAFGSMTVAVEHGRRFNMEDLSSLKSLVHTSGTQEERDLTQHGRIPEVPCKILRERAGYFGIGLSNFSRLLNPDIIVLSGPLMMDLPNYYQECIDAFCQSSPHIAGTPFSKGGLFQQNSIAVGSAAMVIEHLCNSKVV